MKRKTTRWTPPAAAAGQRRFETATPIVSTFRLPEILPRRIGGWFN